MLGGQRRANGHRLPLPSGAPQLFVLTATVAALRVMASASLLIVRFCKTLYPTRFARGATPRTPRPLRSRAATIPVTAVPWPDVVSVGSFVGSVLPVT